MASSRPYVAAAAAAVLAALYFVPSASASPDRPAAARPASATTQSTGEFGLADTGAVDTTPYLIGGAAFLVAYAGLVLNAGRRARENAAA